MGIEFFRVDKSTRLTISQILKLEYAIGYSLATVRRRIHRMCRNFAETGTEPDEEWEQLCRMGLATHSTAFGRHIYRVTQRGIDTVGMITDCKICMEPNVFDGKELEEDAGNV